MKALITGASSGIGYEIASYLNELGHDLILVGRDKEQMQMMQEEFKVDVKIIVADLSIESKLKEVYVLCRSENVDILVNNAGFGVFGKFEDTDLAIDLELIDVNIRAVYVLTKLFLKEMKKKNSGYILNVASAAAFQPGPLMANYYASKAYVLRISQAIREELRRDKSKVSISCLCPGPVKTNFNKRANVEFAVKPLDAKVVARYAIDKMFKKKAIIVPGLKMKTMRCISKLSPSSLSARVTYKIQRKKQNWTFPM